MRTSSTEPLTLNPAAPLCSGSVRLTAAWHSLAWLVVANSVGVLLALLLLAPSLNVPLQPLTYGRWMPVHVNLQLYGWCSLPLVAFLFVVYGVDTGRTAPWARPVLWVWSAALVVAVVSWLSGHSSGKLFLDWTGYARVAFPAALLALWGYLAIALGWYRREADGRRAWALKAMGLLLLAPIPWLIYFAADPNIYPPINPDSGGPTGASQLESVLVIVALLLVIPFGISRRLPAAAATLRLCWGVFAAEAMLCLALGRSDISHHRPAQYISLGSLLVWLPLIPKYCSAFAWHDNTRRWRIAMMLWWSVLVPTGWCLFLPGVLDHFKFTDGLVAHSLLAMAGFSSSLLIFLLVQILGEDGWIFNRTWSFYLWNISVLAYVIVMLIAGWREGNDPAFSFRPELLRQALYGLRLLLGLGMLAASLEWLLAANTALRKRASSDGPAAMQPQEQAA